MLVKICGITSLTDAILATELGSWALGFNFYEKSLRYIAPEKAAEIISQLPKRVKAVGVFVNATMDYILSVKNITNIDFIQFHGNESLDFCSTAPFPFIKAIRSESEFLLENFQQYSNFHAILIDSYDSKQFGGTGKKSDWVLAQSLTNKIPTILAGGLNSENIQAAILDVQPYAIDVCSGVEESPGKKSTSKMIEFFNVLKTETEKYE